MDSALLMKAGLVDLDVSFFIQVALFLVFYFVLRRMFFGPYAQMLKRREEATEGLRKRAAEMSEKARQIEDEVERRLKSARNEALLVRRRLIEEGMRLKDEIARRERARMHSELERYLEQLEREKQECLGKVDETAKTLAQLVEEQLRVVGR